MSKYLNDIKAASIPLSDGMSITDPFSSETGKLSLRVGEPKTYNIVGGRIIFIDERCNAFAIPAIPGIKGILVCDGYRKDDSLEVPFSSRECYPTAHKEKWDALLAEMREAV